MPILPANQFVTSHWPFVGKPELFFDITRRMVLTTELVCFRSSAGQLQRCDGFLTIGIGRRGIRGSNNGIHSRLVAALS